MLFSGLNFIFFFLPLFLLLYFTAKKIYTKNIILLVFSLVFYAWGEPLYIFLMLFSIAMNYFFALGIEKCKIAGKAARPLLAAAVAANLALIGFFKYAGFLISIINSVAPLDLPVPSIPLPIGISFYTFQILSYVIDVYNGTVPAQRDILFLGTYLSAFPQLIAGPIVRYETVADELVSRSETVPDFAAGLRRFIAGLAKKVLIANTMAQTVDGILGYAAADYGFWGAWIAVLGYTLQIYYDFSGYSDMAIGMGRMMGFHYLENFNYPYAARSVTDFWRRWHISLSTFFRDYVYIPLGGNRVTTRRWIFNMSVVWVLTGLWHGASWNFILWGVYFGILLICEKLIWGRYIEKLPAAGHIYAAVCFIFGWVLFRAETLSQTGEILSAMAGLYGTGGGSVALPILLQSCNFDLVFVLTFATGIVIAMPVRQKLQMYFAGKKYTGAICDSAAVICFLVCVVSLAVGAYNPFIYFRF